MNLFTFKYHSMKKSQFLILFIIIILFLVAGSIQAQRALGLVFDDAAYRQIETLQTYEGEKYNNIPLKVSFREQCPFPNDQGDISSCVGESCSVAYTIGKARMNKVFDRKQINRFKHSASYI